MPLPKKHYDDARLKKKLISLAQRVHALEEDAASIDEDIILIAKDMKRVESAVKRIDKNLASLLEPDRSKVITPAYNPTWQPDATGFRLSDPSEVEAIVVSPEPHIKKQEKT